MKKVKVYCLNCYKKNEVETGVECTCPKCGSTFSLKEEATSDRANKLKDKINLCYDLEEKQDYMSLAINAKDLIENVKEGDETFQAWYFLAIAQAKIIEKLIDENKFNNSKATSTVDDYFEMAFENCVFSEGHKMYDYLKEMHINFLRKNLIHACEWRIQQEATIVEQLKAVLSGELKEDPFSYMSAEKKEEYIQKGLESIEKNQKEMEGIKNLDNEALKFLAKSTMGKNGFVRA